MDNTLYGAAASNFTGSASQLKHSINNALKQVKALYGSPINNEATLDEVKNCLVKMNKTVTEFSKELDDLAFKESN